MFKLYVAALVKHNQVTGWVKKTQHCQVHRKIGQKLTQSLTGTIFLKTYAIYMVLIRHCTSWRMTFSSGCQSRISSYCKLFFNNRFPAASEENRLRSHVEETQGREDTLLHLAVLDLDFCSNRLKVEIWPYNLHILSPVITSFTGSFFLPCL